MRGIGNLILQSSIESMNVVILIVYGLLLHIDAVVSYKFVLDVFSYVVGLDLVLMNGFVLHFKSFLCFC